MHGMRDAPRILCSCGAVMHKAVSTPQFIWPADAYWGNENNGKGRYISGLGRKEDPASYATSLSNAQEKAKAKGLSYELT
jgi:hypothetical protein